MLRTTYADSSPPLLHTVSASVTLLRPHLPSRLVCAYFFRIVCLLSMSPLHVRAGQMSCLPVVLRCAVIGRLTSHPRCPLMQPLIRSQKRTPRRSAPEIVIGFFALINLVLGVIVVLNACVLP